MLFIRLNGGLPALAEVGVTFAGESLTIGTNVVAVEEGNCHLWAILPHSTPLHTQDNTHPPTLTLTLSTLFLLQPILHKAQLWEVGGSQLQQGGVEGGIVPLMLPHVLQ